MTPRDRLLARLDELEKVEQAMTPDDWVYSEDEQLIHNDDSTIADLFENPPADGPGIVAARRFLKPLLALARAEVRKHYPDTLGNEKRCYGCREPYTLVADCPVIAKYAFLHESQVLEGK